MHRSYSRRCTLIFLKTRFRAYGKCYKLHISTFVSVGNAFFSRRANREVHPLYGGGFRLMILGWTVLTPLGESLLDVLVKPSHEPL